MNERLHSAIDLAARAHQGQYRKDADMKIPYVAHVYGVAMILQHHGFSQDVVIAGLLHDVLEDSPEFMDGVVAFGPSVQRWVETVSDPQKTGDGKGSVRGNWLERKAPYIAQIRDGDLEAKAIACADKIHNMASTLMGLERGAKSELKRPLEIQVEYWRRVREAFGAWQHPMLTRYDELLESLAKRQ